jgi:hypothetical protein
MGGGDRWFESPSAHLPVKNNFMILEWDQFYQFLSQRMEHKTALERLRYSRKYVQVLQTRDASILLQLSPDNRINAMKALSSLAKYTGLQNTWKQIRQDYALTWSTGTEKLNAFTRFFDDSRSLDVMLQWLREAVRALPSKYANLLLFCTLTGMRGSEAVESVRLLNIGSDNLRTYYNPDRQIPQHYLYPQIFIRGTKAIYISIVNDEIIGIAKNIAETPPTQNGLKRAIARSSLNMRIKYCRKIHASYLHKKGISSDMIDALQGRISKSIFLRHYLTPSAGYKDSILDAITELQQQISG